MAKTQENLLKEESNESTPGTKRLRLHAIISYVIGIFFLGLLIGYVSGMSDVPIVATLLPLLFGLISAGTGLYILRSQLTSKSSLLKLSVLAYSLVALSVSVYLGSVYGINIRTGSSYNDFIPFAEAKVGTEKVGIGAGDPFTNVELIILRSKLKLAGAQPSEIDRILYLMSNNANSSSVIAQKDSLQYVAIQQLDQAIIVIGRLTADRKTSMGDSSKFGNRDVENRLYYLKKKLIEIRPLVSYYRSNVQTYNYSIGENIESVLNQLNTILADSESLNELGQKQGVDVAILNTLYNTFSLLYQLSSLGVFDMEKLNELLDKFNISDDESNDRSFYRSLSPIR
jgi:hypothetical protein